MAILDFACEAARLAGALTDGELVVLMASQGVRKRGRTHRVFALRDLLKVSVTDPLRGLGESLPQCLHGLVRKGMLAKRGRLGFIATSFGNVVKHSFNELDRNLRTTSLTKSRQARDPRRLALLRASMGELCNERGARALPSPP